MPGVDWRMRRGPVYGGPEFWTGSFYLEKSKGFEMRKYPSKVVGTVGGAYYMGNCESTNMEHL